MRYAAILCPAFQRTMPGGRRSPLPRTAALLVGIAAVLCAFTPGTPIAADERAGITLVAGGQTRQITTTAKCVAEVLAEGGIALAALDRVTPRLDAPVTEGLKITVVRVARKTEQRSVPIPPGTISRFDRRVGRPVVLDPGKSGLKRETFSILIKDGRETERTLLDSEVVREPTPRRVVIGRASSLPARGASMMLMNATAYDPGPLSCGRYASGYTAIGMKAGKGVVAVDPRVIPLGTHLYIEGYGPAVAADVGSAIRGRRIDLGFGTRREALAFGRRNVKVYIVD